MHLTGKEQVPPSPLSVPDTFRTAQDKIKTNRAISAYCAVFFNVLFLSTQDRFRTEKRPNETTIGGKLVAQISVTLSVPENG